MITSTQGSPVIDNSWWGDSICWWGWFVFLFGLHWVLVWKSLFPKLLFANFQNDQTSRLEADIAGAFQFSLITFAQSRTYSHSVISIKQALANPPDPILILWGWVCIYFHARCFTLVHMTDLNLDEATHSYRSHRCGDSRQLWGDGLLVLPLFFESFFAREPLSSLLSASRILDLPSCKFTQKFSATDSCAIWYHL